MATSLLFAASDQNIKLHLGYEETKPEPTKSNRGRKPSKTPQQKKQPQRGLGVAQLERLRLQEGRKKINENQILQLQPLNHSGQFHLQTVQPANITEPLGGVPVQYGALNCNGVPVLINGSITGGLFGVDRPGLVLQRTGITHGLGGDFVDPRFYGIQGGSDQGQIRLHGAAYETSKELSSIPNNISGLSSGCCDTFCKMKKPLDGGNQNIGFNFPNAAKSNSCNNKDCNNNLDEGVEVVKIHRKGSGGKGLVMEYEFFPDAPPSDRSTYPEESDEETSVAYSVDDDESTNFVDLSLKLSYS